MPDPSPQAFLSLESHYDTGIFKGGDKMFWCPEQHIYTPCVTFQHGPY
jgi:hypothetical protein